MTEETVEGSTTTSTGISVILQRNGGGLVHTKDLGSSMFLDAACMKAFEELLIARRDSRLSRWRPEARNHMVVYPDPTREDWVLVVDETDGRSYWRTRTERKDIETNDFDYAAEFYFRQHPVKREWHDAAHNSVWELTITRF